MPQITFVDQINNYNKKRKMINISTNILWYEDCAPLNYNNLWKGNDNDNINNGKIFLNFSSSNQNFD